MPRPVGSVPELGNRTERNRDSLVCVVFPVAADRGLITDNPIHVQVKGRRSGDQVEAPHRLDRADTANYGTLPARRGLRSRGSGRRA